MRIKSAARLGIILVLVHMVMFACTDIAYLLMMLSRMGMGIDTFYIVCSLTSLIAGIILDIALLMVFGSLSRTKEQLIRDEGDDFS